MDRAPRASCAPTSCDRGRTERRQVTQQVTSSSLHHAFADCGPPLRRAELLSADAGVAAVPLHLLVRPPDLHIVPLPAGHVADAVPFLARGANEAVCGFRRRAGGRMNGGG